MSDKPKVFGQMTDAEKVALVEGFRDGMTLEAYSWNPLVYGSAASWRPDESPKWHPDVAYRVRPKPLRLTVGKRYLAKNDDAWECIFVCGDVAWMAQCLTTQLGVAYRFNLDGTCTDLDAEYNIVAELP